MKLNKTFGRIATTLVATAMLASMAVVPASANQFNESGVIGYGENHEQLTEIKFTKELKKPADVMTPNVTFTFKMNNSEDVEDGATYTSDNKQVNLYNGVGATDITGIAEFSPDEQGMGPDTDEDFNVVSTTVTFNIESLTGFTDAGVYKYDITEETVSQPYYAGNDLELYLFVERYTDAGEEKYKATGAVLTVAGVGGAVGAKTDSTMNGYMVDPTDPNPDPVTSDLAITKTVEGSMGNYGEEFNFTVSLPGDAADKYNAQYEKEGSEPVPTTLTGGSNINIKLSHGETLRIYGLISGYEYTITEDDYGSKGYTTTIEDVSGRTLTEEYDSSDKDISVVNTRAAVSPTGLIMDIAPYVLLVVVAAAGCFVFLRKRRED